MRPIEMKVGPRVEVDKLEKLEGELGKIGNLAGVPEKIAEQYTIQDVDF